MTTTNTPSRTLSEIGHLFLTDLRQKQGGPRPHRVPPPSNASAQQTPEEFERACNAEPASPETDKPAASVTALLSGHLLEREGHWIQSYARHAALTAGRIGLIEIDSAELKISCFERSPNFDFRAVHDAEADAALEPLEERRMAQAMEELAWDVDRWLLYVHTARSAQGRSLFRLVDQWSLLTTADHEGVVAAYRTIKGLFASDHPDLSLVVLDAPDAVQAAAIHQKLSGVCQKFLDCPVRAETPLRDVVDVHQTVVLHCQGPVDEAAGSTGAHWKVISDFLSAMKHPSQHSADTPIAATSHAAPHTAAPSPAPTETGPASHATVDQAHNHARAADPEPSGLIADGVESLSHPSDELSFQAMPAATVAHAADGETAIPMPQPSRPAIPHMTGPRPADPIPATDSDVLDLPEGQSPEMSILAAVLGSAGQFIRCPIAPPDCPASMVTVSRDKRLTLLAVAGPGLSDLRRIAAAFQWMRQNRDLIVMALPQFSISEAAPVLRLLVDQSDLSAGLLHPFLAGGGVTIQPYRKLRWGRKTGLLLEAA